MVIWCMYIYTVCTGKFHSTVGGYEIILMVIWLIINQLDSVIVMRVVLIS